MSTLRCPSTQGPPEPADGSLLGPPVRYRAGADFLRLGDEREAVVFVVAGWACLYHLLEDGRRQVLQFLLPGDAVGFWSAEADLGAAAVTELRVRFVPRGRFMEAAARNPGLLLWMAQATAWQTRMAFEHLTCIGRRTALQRVAFLLLELFVRARQVSSECDGSAIRLPLVQADIADALGLTAVHTNRMLAVLRREGIIELGHNLLQVRHPDRLAEIAGVDHRDPCLSPGSVLQFGC